MSKLLAFFLLLSLVACGGSGGANKPVQPDDKSVHLDDKAPLNFILKIKNQTADDGFLRFEMPHAGKGELERVEIQVDKKVLSMQSNLGGEVSLQTESLTDGKHELTVKAFVVGKSAAVVRTANFTVSNPKAKIKDVSIPTVTSLGETISLTVKTTGNAVGVAADFSKFDGNPTLQQFQKSADGFTLSYQILKPNPFVDGQKDLKLSVKDGSGRMYQQIYEVRLTSEPRLSLSSPVATFESGKFPGNGTDESLMPKPAFDGEAALMSGSLSQLKFELPQNLGAGAQLLIGIEGFSGYLVYQIDALKQLRPVDDRTHAGHTPAGRISAGRTPTEHDRVSYEDSNEQPFTDRNNQPFTADNNTITAPAEIPLGALPDEAKGNWNVKAVIKKPNGDLSKVSSARLAFAAANAGSLRVTMSWNSNTDVDLHVQPPEGPKIYYGNREGVGNALLDVDSNAGCTIDFVNRENVYWLKPKSGEYKVYVQFFDDCAREEGAPPKGAKWHIKAEGCGIKLEKEGEYAPGSDSNGAGGEGELALSFKADCSPYRVMGRAEYKTISPFGSLTTDAMSNVPVRVVSDADGKILGEGKTGFSRFDILYKEPSPPSTVHLEFKLENEFVRVSKSKSQAPYVLKSKDSWDPAAEQDLNKNVMIDIEGGAGAFHIFKYLNEGMSWAAGKGYRLTQTRAEWEANKDNGSTSSFYEKISDVISIRGHADDPDEFDDLVILHEFGHRLVEKFAHDDSWGGKHSSTTRTTPKRAWSEGFASYLAHRIADRKGYSDRSKNSRYFYFVDDLDGVPLGTDVMDNYSFGDISEGVVRAALWDLEDGVEAKENDAVSGKEAALFALVFGKLKTVESFKSGETGKMDFADLIREWGCHLPAAELSPVSTLLEKRFRLPWFSEDDFCSPK